MKKLFAVMGTTPGDGGEVEATNRVEALIQYLSLDVSDDPTAIEEIRKEIEEAKWIGDVCNGNYAVHEIKRGGSNDISS